MSSKSAAMDAGAITLSVLCLIHCLALPLLSATMPMMGVLAEAEWVHRLLVMLAAPMPLIAIIADERGPRWIEFTFLATLGLALLLAAAMIEALHDHETVITVTGACLLSIAHIRRWSRGHNPGKA